MITYSTDTRTLKPGEHFVAIRGERFDGHDFVAEALDKGAAGLVVEQVPDEVSLPDDLPVTVVEDSEHYLGEQARDRLQTLETEVVGITGSVGKTTTKNAVATVLGQAMPVVANEGNLNTVLGLALTVLNRLHEPEQVLVAEMGAYQRGSIRHLCSFFPPTVAVVTVVQPVHLERMGTLENIKLAKSELVEAVPEDGVACLNWDDARVRWMADRCAGRVLSYGEHPEADIRPDRITATIPLLGSYVTQTALAAFSVGHSLGMDAEAINAGLASLTAERGRLRQLPGRSDAMLIDDTYNAALTSTLAALEVLRDVEAERRVAFLGDMLELGEEEARSHREVVQFAVEAAGLDLLVLVGERMTGAAQQVGAADRDDVALYEQSSDVVSELEAGRLYAPASGDAVLAKGSASTRMERIMAHLLRPDVDPGEVLVRQSPGWQQIS
jgi:UDP-N-acetylmuramoyl-tripeptide--D-alanyl-D-alanine ligase